MSNEPRKVKVERLELNTETLASLTDEEAEQVEGAAGGQERVEQPTRRACQSYVDTCDVGRSLSGGCATL